MLFKDRADVLVMDINIFKYFRQNIEDMDVSPAVTFFKIFPPTAYKVAFTDETVRDKFNAGLKAIKASGKYAAIFKTYIKE
jgi:polar amino acid transport system substrate-binding protein